MDLHLRECVLVLFFSPVLCHARQILYFMAATMATTTTGETLPFRSAEADSWCHRVTPLLHRRRPKSNVILLVVGLINLEPTATGQLSIPSCGRRTSDVQTFARPVLRGVGPRMSPLSSLMSGSLVATGRQAAVTDYMLVVGGHASLRVDGGKRFTELCNVAIGSVFRSATCLARPSCGFFFGRYKVWLGFVIRKEPMYKDIDLKWVAADA